MLGKYIHISVWSEIHDFLHLKPYDNYMINFFKFTTYFFSGHLCLFVRYDNGCTPMVGRLCSRSPCWYAPRNCSRWPRTLSQWCLGSRSNSIRGRCRSRSFGLQIWPICMGKINKIEILITILLKIFVQLIQSIIHLHISFTCRGHMGKSDIVFRGHSFQSSTASIT